MSKALRTVGITAAIASAVCLGVFIEKSHAIAKEDARRFSEDIEDLERRTDYGLDEGIEDDDDFYAISADDLDGLD